MAKAARSIGLVDSVLPSAAGIERTISTLAFLLKCCAYALVRMGLKIRLTLFR